MKRGKLKKSAKPNPDKNRDRLSGLDIPPASMEVEICPGTHRSFSFSVTVHENTRLREGDVVVHDGIEQVVIKVNPSCARLIPVTFGTKQVTFTPRFSDKPVVFNAPVQHTVTAISANAECRIVRRLGKNWQQQIRGLSKTTGK